MKPSEIKVGRCYANKSETTVIKILAKVPGVWGWLSVEFIKTHPNRKYCWRYWSIKVFACWAHHEVKEPQVVEEKERNDG